MPSASTTSAGAPAEARKRVKRRKPFTGKADPITTARLTYAATALAQSGKLKGARSKKISVRVDPGLIDAARARTGIANDSDLVSAALAIVAGEDNFGSWLVAQAGRLPKDFELDF
jgi:hypothetical protein